MGNGIIQVFAENAYLIWLGLFIILIVIEIITVGLTTIWFAGGSLAAMLAALLGAGAPVQILVFLAVSCVLLIFTRPWAVKHLNRKRVKTNYESEIGKVIKLTETVNNLDQTGKSTVNGQSGPCAAKMTGNPGSGEPGESRRCIRGKTNRRKYEEES